MGGTEVVWRLLYDCLVAGWREEKSERDGMSNLKKGKIFMGVSAVLVLADAFMMILDTVIAYSVTASYIAMLTLLISPFVGLACSIMSWIFLGRAKLEGKDRIVIWRLIAFALILLDGFLVVTVLLLLLPGISIT